MPSKSPHRSNPTAGSSSSSDENSNHPTHSRNPSAVSTRQHAHAPSAPSNLRESHVPSPVRGLSFSEDDRPSEQVDTHDYQPESLPQPTTADGNQPSIIPDYASIASDPETHADNTQDAHFSAYLKTRLLNHRNWDQESGCGSANCDHGTFTPRPHTHHTYGSIDSTEGEAHGASYPPSVRDASIDSTAPLHGIIGDAIMEGALDGDRVSKKFTTDVLAKRHGIKSKRAMYLAYYIPITNWARQYKRKYLTGDLIAAITMASFYIPMSLSYASNLGHLPAINGMYSFVFNPMIYAILGSCPQMVVGPEAAGSLLTGQVVRENIDRGSTPDENGQESAEIAGIVTFTAGAIILLAGLCRLGFLDSVLSKPFLRGFISAIGVVIFVDQAIPELGLNHVAAEVGGVSHGSCVDKLIFICRHIKEAHGLTAAVSISAFVIIMVLRELKNRLQPRYPNVAYVPDRFIVVVLSAILTWAFGWDKQGLEILGDIKASGSVFAIRFPFRPSHLKYASDAFNSAFIIALLGFFESSVAAKSLRGPEGKDGLKNTSISPNRELTALGVANMVGGLFMALPAFGGYGRSKVNAATGGRTPMSSVFLSLITLFCVLFLLPYFYYLPKGVLSSMVSVVAYSLVEEAPHDIGFFLRIRGWSELFLMFLIFLTTIFWDLKKGIGVGMGLSILRVIRHSTRPRIQILGRVPGTTDRFENAELNPGRLEFIEGCLIVKIPEPLTFANTGDLRSRLRRLEDYGTGAAHPALPRVRKDEHNRNVIFDVHGVTSLDGAGTQVLGEIVESYRTRGVRVFFCRVPSRRSHVWDLFERSGIVAACGGHGNFVNSVQEALRLTEVESIEDEIGVGPEERRYRDVEDDQTPPTVEDDLHLR